MPGGAEDFFNFMKASGIIFTQTHKLISNYSVILNYDKILGKSVHIIFALCDCKLLFLYVH